MAVEVGVQVRDSRKKKTKNDTPFPSFIPLRACTRKGELEGVGGFGGGHFQAN